MLEWMCLFHHGELIGLSNATRSKPPTGGQQEAFASNLVSLKREMTDLTLASQAVDHAREKKFPREGEVTL
jgi:hypothetical protein